jgi:hypothetical protein
VKFVSLKSPSGGFRGLILIEKAFSPNFQRFVDFLGWATGEKG